MMVYDPNDDDENDDGGKVLAYIAAGLVAFIFIMIAVLYFSIQ